eukprot:426033-Alexandrium_andersonii.AAC.2
MAPRGMMMPNRCYKRQLEHITALNFPSVRPAPPVEPGPPPFAVAEPVARNTAIIKVSMTG